MSGGSATLRVIPGSNHGFDRAHSAAASCATGAPVRRLTLALVAATVVVAFAAFVSPAAGVRVGVPVLVAPPVAGPPRLDRGCG
jgi:hypothetical protein